MKERKSLESGSLQTLLTSDQLAAVCAAYQAGFARCYVYCLKVISKEPLSPGSTPGLTSVHTSSGLCFAMLKMLKSLCVIGPRRKTWTMNGQVDSGNPDISACCWWRRRVRKGLKTARRLGPSDRQAGLATTRESFERKRWRWQATDLRARRPQCPLGQQGGIPQ